MTHQILVAADCMSAGAIPCHVVGTDPPYGEHVHTRMTSCAQHGKSKGVRQRDAGFDYLSEELRAFIVEGCRKASRWSLIYTDIQGMGAWETGIKTLANMKTRDGLVRTVPWIDELGSTDGGVVGQYPWIRWSSPQQSGDRWPSGCEMIVVGHAPGTMRWGGPGNVTHLNHKCLRGEGKHTTEKPLDQALDLVAWHSDPGDLWVDYTAGRATFGVACALLGREYLGFEWNKRDPENREARLGQERLALAQTGRLSERDDERFQRWVESMRARAAKFPGRAGPISDGVRDYVGAHFAKGLPA